MHHFRVIWSQNIEAARRAAGLTQMVLADRLHVTQQTVSKWEAGLAVPRDEIRFRLAEVLGVPLHEIFSAPANDGAAA